MFHMKDPRVKTYPSATLPTTNLKRIDREMKTGPSWWDIGGCQLIHGQAPIEASPWTK